MSGPRSMWLTMPDDTKVELQDKFLDVYARTGNIQKSARECGITAHAHYVWMTHDDDYFSKFRLAQEILADRMEAEGFRRAVKGVEKPVFQGGEHVGDVTEYSDALLMFMLRGARPDKYREKVTVVTEDAVDREIARLESELRRRGVDLAAGTPQATTEMRALPSGEDSAEVQ